MAYDFKRLIYGALLFTATVFIYLLIVAQLGANYEKNMSDLGGEIFSEESWTLGTTSAYEDAEELRNSSVTASVTNLDEPTSSKSIFDKISDFALTPFHLIFNVMGVIFQVPGPIMWTFATILIFEIILVVWRLLKQGD